MIYCNAYLNDRKKNRKNSKRIEMLFPNSNTARSLTVMILLIFVAYTGCTPSVKEKYPKEIMTLRLPETLKGYAAFLKQNMEGINERYTKAYIPFNFEVDTDYGSTLIQTFINPEAVSSITDNLGVKNLAYKERISATYNYVLQEYTYIMNPYKWQTVQETIETKKGDCKSLSLLLMSLLLSADIDCYVAISNGHMWTNVFFDNKWHVLEVDKDPDRNKIYQLPAFYENPVYKIFKDRTLKRKRNRNHRDG